MDVTTMSGMGYHSPGWEISRDGNTINVAEPSNGCRHGGDAYIVTLQDDLVTIRSGPFNNQDHQKEFDIKLSPNEIHVEVPNERGMRCGDGFTITPGKSISPADYEHVGLSVASSLIGVPLFFPTAMGTPTSTPRLAPSLCQMDG